MKVSALVLTALFTFGCQSTYAEDFKWSDKLETEFQVAFLGWSQHFGESVKYITNQSHNILAVEYMGYSVGRFDNSFGRETWFVAKNWRWEDLWGMEHVNGTASLGINRGYEGCYDSDGTGSSTCVHGYLGLEYDKYRLIHAVKLQPNAIIYNPEVKFDWN